MAPFLQVIITLFVVLAVGAVVATVNTDGEREKEFDPFDPTGDGDGEFLRPMRCNECPPCDSPALSDMWMCSALMPWRRPEPPLTHARHFPCLRRLLRRVVGQKAAVTGVLQAVERKLLNPATPIVLHFAGDGGTGKTFVAETVSLGLSLRSHPRCATSEGCNFGESFLQLSLPQFALLPGPDARKVIVAQIVAHARRFPYGVVALDDIGAAPHVLQHLPEFVEGHASFHEAPDVLLERLVRIVTSDFGTSGVTDGMSFDHLRDFVMETAKTTFPRSRLRSIPPLVFVPLQREDIPDLLRGVVARFQCRHRNVVSFTLTPDAVDVMVDFFDETRVATKENSRSITYEFERVVLLPVGAVASQTIDTVLSVEVDRGLEPTTSDGTVLRVRFGSVDPFSKKQIWRLQHLRLTPESRI